MHSSEGEAVESEANIELLTPQRPEGIVEFQRDTIQLNSVDKA
jgi:hypothetical protein